MKKNRASSWCQNLPNSLGEEGDPRENPEIGFHSYPEALTREKIRARSESFADHYSQARQFYLSQTRIEQNHIAEALIFELSKVDKIAIMERMVSHLLNIDKELATHVFNGLRLKAMPMPAISAQPVNQHLKKSKATLEVIAPHIGGVKLDDGKWVDAAQNIKVGPSVLYDAIVLLVSKEGSKSLTKEPAARDFIADAFAHLKFIAYVEQATPLLQKAGIFQELWAAYELIKNPR